MGLLFRFNQQIMSIYKLTFRKIQATNPKEKPYKIFDGRGLYVLIKPNGIT